MSCDYAGHVGVEEPHNQPKFRCLYCGSWGYAERWDDQDKWEYENCPWDCTLSYEEHRVQCETLD